MRYLLALLTISALLVLPCVVKADTPTPTPRPIASTPTSIYLYFRPTPTPLSLNINPADFPVNTDTGGLADLSINMWRYGNRDHLFDLLTSGLLAMLIVRYLIRIVNRSTRLND